MRPDFPSSGTERLDTDEDTRAFGARLGDALEPGDVVILTGPLGAGKTTLTQGIGRGMQVRGRITSPTFTIAREHPSLVGGPALVHVDAYRLLHINPADVEGSGETEATVDAEAALDSLDLDTELESAVVVAEWGENLVEHLADCWLEVVIDRTTATEEDPTSQARIISWAQRTRESLS